MHRLIVTEFCTLDGIISDPDGADGTAHGGWAFRHGPAAVSEDKFRLGRIMDDGVLLFGRTTWERFAQRWPARTTEFASRMNAAAKRVVSQTDLDMSAWANSTQLTGDLRTAVCCRAHETRRHPDRQRQRAPGAAGSRACRRIPHSDLSVRRRQR